MRFVFYFAILTVFLLTVLNSCQEATTPAETDFYDQEISRIQLPVIDDYMSEIEGGDLYTDFYFADEAPEFNSKSETTQCGDKKKKNKKKKDCDDDDGDDDEDNDGVENDDDDDDDGDKDKKHRNGCKNGINPLGKILNQLELTKDQKAQIYQFKHDYHDCLKWAKQQIREREREQMKAANAAIKELRAQYRSKDISKEDFYQAKKEIKEQLKNSQKNVIHEEINTCVCDYLNAILTVLDEMQGTEFIDFIQTNHPEFGCEFGGEDDDEGDGPDIL